MNIKLTILIVLLGSIRITALKAQSITEVAHTISEWANSSKGGQADYHEVSPPGERVNLHHLAVPGKITFVDFSSDYCGPCVQLGYTLVVVGKYQPGQYAIRRVNINRPSVTGIDWQSPVAQQFGLRSIPYLVIFDTNGKIIAAGDDAKQWFAARAKQIAAYAKTHPQG